MTTHRIAYQDKPVEIRLSYPGLGDLPCRVALYRVGVDGTHHPVTGEAILLREARGNQEWARVASFAPVTHNVYELEVPAASIGQSTGRFALMYDNKLYAFLTVS